MKKLIINIGQETVVGATYEIKGKLKTVERLFEFPILGLYNNSGNIDTSRIVATVKQHLPKKLRNLDVDLILPSNITDVSYVDAINTEDQAQQKQSHNTMVKTVYIGENPTRKINQKIVYNNKHLSNMISAFHKERINVVRAISNTTCYHNYMSVFNQPDEYFTGDQKTHICVVWGMTKISYIIMIGNLPVEVRTSDLRLLDLYKDITTMGGTLPFHQILKIMNTLTLSPDPDVGILLESTTNKIYDGNNEIVLTDSDMDLVKDRFFTFLTDMVREIRAVYDYVCNKYNTSNVYVCTNSKLVDECLCKTLSDTFPIEYHAASGTLYVYDNAFEIKSIPEFTDSYNPIIGCVIESIKKGGDFYDA